jgi:D-alanyl-D-alanine carboxypeptidase
MTVFDPNAMVAPLAARAAALTGPSNVDPPAVVVEVTRGGRTATTALGVDDRATGVAATPGQTFEVGSHSKMMTAVVVLQLVDEGLIDLDARVADYLPAEVVSGIPNAASATVRQLLAMRSGIPNYTEAGDIYEWLKDHPGQEFGPDQALATARAMSATNAPGAAFHYSNTPYLLLGSMIEAVTGDSWAAALEDRVFVPAGMRDTTARTYDPDPQRLSSYRLDGGSLVDVTDDRWVARGESGVASTTGDLIAFISALMLDRTLLSDAMLDEMLSFTTIGTGNAFGLGIFRQQVSGSTVYGFAGGTLGTSSVTWYDPANGTFVSMAGTLAGVDCGQAAKQLQVTLRSLSDWAMPDGGPVEVRSVSAAGLTVGDTAEGVCFAAGGASLTLGFALRALAVSGATFADGSVLVVGDGAAGTAGDDAANLISIPVDHRSAINARNQLLGLGGDDALTGGRAGDRIDGGAGDDRARGAGGDDLVLGGGGADLLIGGTGADHLRGGGGGDLLAGRAGVDFLVGGVGRDVFRFDDGETRAAAPDIVADFTINRDRIDLDAVDAVAGGRDSAFHWIGAGGFSGAAGELRLVDAGADTRVEGDTDGDGHADLALLLADLDGLAPRHFLL